MAATSHLTLIEGKTAARTAVRSLRTVDRLNVLFAATARRIWPTKTAANLARVTCVSQRSAEFWLAGQKDISIESARALIQSEDGYEFLAAFMGDANPRWWKRVRHSYELGQTRRAIKETEKRLAMLKQGELDL